MWDWISEIPCIACWEWWEVILGLSSIAISISGYLWRNYTAEGQMDEIKSHHTINDLKFIEDYMDWLEEGHIRPDGDIDLVGTKWTDAKKLSRTQTLIAKHLDWFSSIDDIPREKRVSIISLQASESIDLITRYGYKKALKIRKRELENP